MADGARYRAGARAFVASNVGAGDGDFVGRAQGRCKGRGVAAVGILNNRAYFAIGASGSIGRRGVVTFEGHDGLLGRVVRGVAGVLLDHYNFADLRGSSVADSGSYRIAGITGFIGSGSFDLFSFTQTRIGHAPIAFIVGCGGGSITVRISDRDCAARFSSTGDWVVAADWINIDFRGEYINRIYG